MTLEYATVKSGFHGGGIHSRHHTGEAAYKEAKRWGGSPGLALAVLKDGQWYQADVSYMPGSGFIEVIGISEDPLPEAHTNMGARRYYV